MRYSDLSGKEIIDLHEGARLGVISETDLLIDTASGQVEAILIPYRGRFFAHRTLMVPWEAIQKVGPDLIIVDVSTFDPSSGRLKPPPTHSGGGVRSGRGGRSRNTDFSEVAEDDREASGW